MEAHYAIPHTSIIIKIDSAGLPVSGVKKRAIVSLWEKNECTVAPQA